MTEMTYLPNLCSFTNFVCVCVCSRKVVCDKHDIIHICEESVRAFQLFFSVVDSKTNVCHGERETNVYFYLPHHFLNIADHFICQRYSLSFSGGSREIKRFDDIAKFRNETGTSSVMLARAIQWNPSILRREGFLPIEDVIKSYLKYVGICLLSLVDSIVASLYCYII